MKPTTIDFETYGIEKRPDYPPKPVGVSIKYWGEPAKYYAWGHHEGNNSTFEDAKKALEEAYKTEDGILFHNANFDLDVAETHMGVGIPHWSKIHDTMFLLFLDDPNQIQLGLKPSAERLLNLPPEEQDAIKDYLLLNQPVEGVKISPAKSNEHYFARYIAYADGDLVGQYANGDVERTEQLFNLLYPRVVFDNDMSKPYDRERQLLPILLEMERQGLAVDFERLKSDTEKYFLFKEKAEDYILGKLGNPSGLNLDSGQELFARLLYCGFVDESKAVRTKTGKFSTTKDALIKAVNDKELVAVLSYRASLKTCLSTFMVPWLETAKKSGGVIYTKWNQVKGASGIGTRTGRLSSTPNFQNIPNEFKPLFKHEKEGLPECPIKDLPPLPKVRSYAVPFNGHVFIDRDYSQQEPRILAHYDGAAMQEKYEKNPWIDFHDSAKEELERRGVFYARKQIKGVNLGILYGMGVKSMSESIGISLEDTKKLKGAILSLYPSIKEMYSTMRMRAKSNLPIRTWGGRQYYCEQPKMIDGKLREFDYKMVNTLMQGSAADCTKEAIIRFHEKKSKDWKIIFNIHDQITVSVPKKDIFDSMEVLRETMESIEFDVPMLSEGSYSEKSLDDLKDFDIKGKIVISKEDIEATL